jgi:hypothetical protein
MYCIEALAITVFALILFGVPVGVVIAVRSKIKAVIFSIIIGLAAVEFVLILLGHPVSAAGKN